MLTRRKLMWGKSKQIWTAGLKNGCVHLWELDGDANDKIGDWHMPKVMPGASVSYTSGVMKKAISFNGTGGVETAIATSNTTYTKWTYSFWIKTQTQVDAYGTILARSSNASSGIFLSSSYKLFMASFQPAHTSTITIPINTWTHVSIMNTGLYINGALKESYSLGSHLLSSGNIINIGAVYYGGLRNCLNASLEQLAIWDRNLTATEIAQLYNNGVGLYYD